MERSLRGACLPRERGCHLPDLGSVVQWLGMCALEQDGWAENLALPLHGCEISDTLLIPLSLHLHLWAEDDGSKGSSLVRREGQTG